LIHFYKRIQSEVLQSTEPLLRKPSVTESYGATGWVKDKGQHNFCQF